VTNCTQDRHLCDA